MARAKKHNVNREANEAFLQYEEEIAAHPAYAGMPDLRYEDGSIQWETPSNRNAGVFRFSHDKRYWWWVAKAAEVGIHTDENEWISKVAKRIHPTKLHPCKICGRVMDIRYSYLSNYFINRVHKLSFYNGDIDMSETMHIFDFLTAFVDTYGEAAFSVLPWLLTCIQCMAIPSLENDLSVWIRWIDEEYIPREPSILGPGAMANPPDRLDGFHTYNRCCRPSADKGRSKENLASYSTDRRAFENWSDGNWITANKMMGFINSNAEMKREPCANEGNGARHTRPCSADHIGPISLGFCHRPEFQFLCQSCNSAKNNRMYFSDVIHLLGTEATGEVVTTWYASAIWQYCKERVVDKETALRLSRIMRDNRNMAMMLLSEFADRGYYLFLLTLLNLEYADHQYEIIQNSVHISYPYVSAQFAERESTSRYAAIQKNRKIRVAFSSLSDYAKKQNRNGYTVNTPAIEELKQTAFGLLDSASEELRQQNDALICALQGQSNAALGRIVAELDYRELKGAPIFVRVRELLAQIMGAVAYELASNWDDPRYARDIIED